MEVEFGRKGVSGRIDVFCRDTNAIFWDPKDYKDFG
jgi:hypothetical protein